MKNKESIVMTAVQQDGWALYSASAELRADRAVVMAAVQQNGKALKYASAELRADMAVVMVAVQQNGLALGFHQMKSGHPTHPSPQPTGASTPLARGANPGNTSRAPSRLGNRGCRGGKVVKRQTRQ